MWVAKTMYGRLSSSETIQLRDCVLLQTVLQQTVTRDCVTRDCGKRLSVLRRCSAAVYEHKIVLRPGKTEELGSTAASSTLVA